MDRLIETLKIRPKASNWSAICPHVHFETKQKGQWSDVVDAALCSKKSGKLPSAPPNRTRYLIWPISDKISHLTIANFHPRRVISLISVSSDNCQKTTPHCSVQVWPFPFGLHPVRTWLPKSFAGAAVSRSGYFTLAVNGNAPVKKISLLLMHFHLVRCVATTSEVMHNVSIKHTIRCRCWCKVLMQLFKISWSPHHSRTFKQSMSSSLQPSCRLGSDCADTHQCVNTVVCKHSQMTLNYYRFYSAFHLGLGWQHPICMPTWTWKYLRNHNIWLVNPATHL